MIHVAEFIVLSLYHSLSRHSIEASRISWALLATLASAAILYKERRLVERGLYWGCTGIFSLGVTRGLFRIGTRKSEHDYGASAIFKSRHGFAFMSLILGLILNCAAAIIDEHSILWHKTSLSTKTLALLSTSSWIGTIFLGCSPMVYYPVAFKCTISAHPQRGLPQCDTLVSAASTLFILLANVCFSPQMSSSWTQIISYFFAVVSVTELNGGCTVNSSRPSLKTPRKGPRVWNIHGLFDRAITLLPVYLALAFLYLRYSASLTPLPNQSVMLDSTYVAKSRFDIVVSMYRESPSAVKAMLNTIKTTKYISTLQPRVILYTKDPNADLYLLKNDTSADIVRQLANVGREGGTYLHHIVTHWDDLAQQTMFIQADVHDPEELLSLIKSYLVPKTGMLSLGYTAIQCKCGACEDIFSWEDRWKLVPDLYRKLYNRSCDTNTPILLTYKGQFIASSGRIRGIGKIIYEDLLQALTSMEGWSHDLGERYSEHKNSPDSPVLGFTVERIWGLLMQCGLNDRITARCPSLLSGRWIEAEASDCQCLDE